MGGGVELTIISLIKGLISLGHKIILIAPHKFSESPQKDICKFKIGLFENLNKLLLIIFL